MSSELDELRQKLHSETAQMSWLELERFYAEGKLITVTSAMDLIDVAASVAENNSEQIKQWMDDDKIMNTTDEQALAWQKRNADLWTVLVMPWILIQDRDSAAS